MAKGLKLPLGVDETGGAARADGETKNRQIIFTALSDCDNDNAFQQELGLGTGVIFDINDAGSRARVLNRLTEIFERFEVQHRFKLKPETVRWAEQEGEMILEFIYLDLESDEEQSFTRSFTPR